MSTILSPLHQIPLKVDYFMRFYMSQKLLKSGTMYTLRRATCPTHGLQPCYTACSCVVKFSQPATRVTRPSKAKSGIGEILCKRNDHELHEMVVVCVMCAQQNGWDQINAT